MDEKTNMSKDEQIGFHKGAISVLSKEREEMLKIAQITEQLLQLHMKQLEEMGVDLSSVQPQEEKKDAPRKKVPIESLI